MYAGIDEFVTGMGAGVAAGEPSLVVVSARKVALLREALDGDADGVLFAARPASGRTRRGSSPRGATS